MTTIVDRSVKNSSPTITEPEVDAPAAVSGIDVSSSATIVTLETVDTREVVVGSEFVSLYPTGENDGGETGCSYDDSSSPPPDVAVDDFLPSCDDVIDHLFNFRDVGDDDDVGSPTAPTTSTSTITTTSGSESRLEAEVTSPEIASPLTIKNAAPATVTVSHQNNMAAAVISGETSLEATRNAALPMTAEGAAVRFMGVQSSSSVGDVPVVYLLTGPGIRGATGAVGGIVSQTGNSSVTSPIQNGDVRPLLRFMQISKRPPGAVLTGPAVGQAIAAGLHLVGPRPAPAGSRLTPVFSPVIRQPPSLTSPTAATGLALVPLAAGTRPPDGAAAGGGVASTVPGGGGVVRFASVPNQRFAISTAGLSTSSAAAAIFLSRLCTSTGNSMAATVIEAAITAAGQPRQQTSPFPVSTIPLQYSPIVGSTVASSTASRSRSANRAHHQTASPTSAVSPSRTPGATTGSTTSSSTVDQPSASSVGTTASRQTVQEKNAYEYERVMDILRYYRELVVERKLPGACLPCKRRKSKPLVSVAPGQHQEEEPSPPLPIPPPPPPPTNRNSQQQQNPQSTTAVPPTATALIGIVPVSTASGASATASIRVPFASANGLPPVGVLPVPFNVRQLAAAVFPQRFLVAPPMTSSASGNSVIAPRLVFYAATPSAPIAVSTSASALTVATGNCLTTKSASTDSGFGSTVTAMPETDQHVRPTVNGSIISMPNRQRRRSAETAVTPTTKTGIEAIARCRSRSRSVSDMEIVGLTSNTVNEFSHLATTTHVLPTSSSLPARSDSHLRLCFNGHVSVSDQTASDLHVTSSLRQQVPSDIALETHSASVTSFPGTTLSSSPSCVDSEYDSGMMAVRLARKRHLVDSDTDDPLGSEVEAVRLSSDMETTYAELMQTGRTSLSSPATALIKQPVAIKESGYTSTTGTIVTKWTSSRLAVSGPYQSWT